LQLISISLGGPHGHPGPRRVCDRVPGEGCRNWAAFRPSLPLVQATFST